MTTLSESVIPLIKEIKDFIKENEEYQTEYRKSLCEAKLAEVKTIMRIMRSAKDYRKEFGLQLLDLLDLLSDLEDILKVINKKTIIKRKFNVEDTNVEKKKSKISIETESIQDVSQQSIPKNSTEIPKEQTVANARRKFTRATHEYRESMIAGKSYLYRDHLSHTNPCIFRIKGHFALFDASRVRAPNKYKFEETQEDITFEDYLIETNVLRAELGLAPCRSPVDQPVIDQAVDDQPGANFLSMEEAMEMEFSPENSQNDPEIIENAADSATNNNVQNMEFVGQLNDEDAFFLDQYLSLNEVTKKEVRNAVAALCNPAVIVQKIPKN